MSRWKDVIQPVLLALMVVVVASLGFKIQQLEERLKGLESAQAEHAMPRVPDQARSASAPIATRQVVSTAAVGDIGSTATQAAPSIDDHLWSEDGREAIGDVVEEREEADRERRSERWRKVAEYRTQKAVGAVAENLSLSDDETEELTALVDTYMEVRSRRWRQMSNDEDLDIAQIEREYESSRDEVEQELVALIGDDGLELLQEEIRKGWR